MNSSMFKVSPFSYSYDPGDIVSENLDNIVRTYMVKNGSTAMFGHFVYGNSIPVTAGTPEAPDNSHKTVMVSGKAADIKDPYAVGVVTTKSIISRGLNNFPVNQTDATLQYPDQLAVMVSGSGEVAVTLGAYFEGKTAAAFGDIVLASHADGSIVLADPGTAPGTDFMATGWYYCGVPNAVTYPTPGMPAVNSMIYITKRIIVKGN